MGSIILCQTQKAKNPYEITRIHKKIGTIEELCYYLCNNVHLVDNTIMNEQFCGWIEEELGLLGLANNLRNALWERCGKTTFILIVLRSTSIYTASELNRISDVLNKLKDLREVERQKKKADNLLENGEVDEAIVVYQTILRADRDLALSDKFYGTVYACLGAAYGRLFLYHEAMNMYDKAFQICNDPVLVKCYLYCAKKSMKEVDYKLFLSKSEVFEELEEILETEIDNLKQSIQIEPSNELLQSWKKVYRLGNKN